MPFSKATRCFALALLLLFTVAICEETPDKAEKPKTSKKSKPYRELTDESKFGKFITTHDNALVLFYAPWCKHCKNLMPAFKEASERLKSAGVTLSARINGDKFKNVADSYKVDGFPTLIAFKKTVPYVYRGDQTSDDIVDFATKVASPPLRSLNTQDEFDAFVAAHPTTAVACFAPSAAAGDGNEGEDEQNEYNDEEMASARKAFFMVASNIHMYSDIYFGVVDNPDVKTGRQPSGYPSVVLNAPGYPLREYAFGQMGADDNDEQKKPSDVIARGFIRWLDTATIPILDNITNDNYMRYIDVDLPIVWLVLRDMNDEGTVNWFRSIAEQYAGKLLFVILDE